MPGTPPLMHVHVASSRPPLASSMRQQTPSRPGTPQIPVQMAGGHAIPGSVRQAISRPPTPYSFPAVPGPAITHECYAFGSNKYAAPFRGFESRAPTPAGPASTSASPRYRMDPALEMAWKQAADFAAFREQPPPAANPATAQAPLYGQAFLTRTGQVMYKPSPRLDTWLADLSRCSPPLSPEADLMDGVQFEDNHDLVATDSKTDKHDFATTTDATHAKEDPKLASKPEHVAAGSKRSSDKITASQEQPASEDQRASKRSRLGKTVCKTLSRISRLSISTRRSKGPSNAVADAAPPRSAAPSPAPPRNIFSRMSLLSRAGRDDGGDNLGAAAVAVAALAAPAVERKIKVCLVGDSNSGKTALANRLISGRFSETSPSLSTDCRTFTAVTNDNRLISVELWDFPGSANSSSSSSSSSAQMMATYFHAAVICYSVEDEANIETAMNVWKPKLDHSLIECPLFVLGLKKELRPSFPSLGLSFLPAAVAASATLGRSRATQMRAAGFGECSAKTGDNVQEAWRGIVNFVVDGLRMREAGGRGRRRGSILRPGVGGGGGGTGTAAAAAAAGGGSRGSGGKGDDARQDNDHHEASADHPDSIMCGLPVPSPWDVLGVSPPLGTKV
ncbi:hypothetical protein B0T24DRAFT_595603 [Lasiosphaeria ovina]|uniref:Uncharacterized protein n=1 Tax=Lasiosphaeria ovina TaxID=92902 RepID=A0AAE0K7Z9_9PEZI|nr:hypothetical protein B0T24DRAFT_595603 [Lasiosphaeria ovina]